MTATPPVQAALAWQQSVPRFIETNGVSYDALFTVPNVAALRLLPIPGPSVVLVQYNAALGDDMGGHYYWDATNAAGDTDDGQLVIVPTAAPGGVWRLLGQATGKTITFTTSDSTPYTHAVPLYTFAATGLPSVLLLVLDVVQVEDGLGAASSAMTVTASYGYDGAGTVTLLGSAHTPASPVPVYAVSVSGMSVKPVAVGALSTTVKWLVRISRAILLAYPAP